MVIISWMTRFTVLGVKVDQCQKCGQVCRHVVGRRTRWAGVFWLPLLFLGFSHGMLCSTCGSWTGIPWRQDRAATRTGLLPLSRVRPDAAAVLAAGAAEHEPPLSSAVVFDRMAVSPEKGPWDLYLKAWPLLVAGIIGIGAVTPLVSGGARPSPSPGTDKYPTPHTCWVAADGGISGCRLANGTIEGRSTGTQTTCYFLEPLSEVSPSLRCDP